MGGRQNHERRCIVKLPFVISLPHCSDKIPERIRPHIVLTRNEMLDSVDVGVREIFGCLPAERVLCAPWSRLVVDLNRSPDQRGAKGLAPLVDYHGRPVYDPHATPDEKEIEDRLTAYYQPYHRQLQNALQIPHIKGLLDCHSLKNIGPPGAPDAGKERKDIVLGNNGGPGGENNPVRGKIICPSALLNFMKRVFEEAGFSVSLNIPYAGGFITTHYGRMLVTNNKMALQIEINQGLYVDSLTEKIMPSKLTAVRAGIFKCLLKIGGAIRVVN